MSIGTESTVDEIVNKAISRRKVLAMGAGAVAGLSMLGLAGKAMADDTPDVTDADVLNFALNLEYLEAEFYTVATTGKTLSQSGIGTRGTGTYGPTTGGSMVDFSSMKPVGDVAYEIAEDERQHVLILRKNLGSAAIAKPTINLNAAGQGFASIGSFLVLARALEDTGVSAYAGAAPDISSSSYLGLAARILAVEAYHAGNIRLMIAQMGLGTGALDQYDVLPPPSGSQYFTTKDALAVIRTPNEVLSIVYAATGATMGGFFPDGVNGAITHSGKT